MKRLESPIRIFLFKLVRINRSSCKSDCFSWSEAIGFMRVWLYGNIKFQNFLTKSTSCIWKSGRLPSYLSYYKNFSRCPARSSIALRNPLYLRLGGCHTPPHPPTIFAPDSYPTLPIPSYFLLVFERISRTIFWQKWAFPSLPVATPLHARDGWSILLFSKWLSAVSHDQYYSRRGNG